MPKSRHYSGKCVRLGYQTNLLILSAGGYKFTDFLKVGIPLAIIMWVGFSVVLPLLYDI